MDRTTAPGQHQRAATLLLVALGAALAGALVAWARGGGVPAALLAGLLALGLAAAAAARERARAHARLAAVQREDERRRAHLQQALADRQAAESFLRLVADALPARLSYWDRDNRCRFANRAFCEWHDVSPEQVLGRRIAELGPPWDRRAQANAPHVAAVLAGQGQRFEREDMAHDGERRVSLACYVPDRQADEVVGFIALSFDLTAEKARERELAAALLRAEAATRAKSAFLANMSHEIRTPLNAVLGLVQVLRHDVTEPASAARLARVEEASRHLLALLGDVLDLARVEAGKLGLELQDVDLAALLTRVQALLADRAAERGLTLALQTDGLPPRVHTDPTRLTQVLLNLAGNAVKFTEQGTVTLSARVLEQRPEGWRVRFEVADTGPGIAPERLATLFEPFEQGDASSTRRHGGTGLGLSISREVVALLGGRLEMRPRPEGGSAFGFELLLPPPAATAAPAPVPDAVPVLRAAHAGRCVLLVEDNPLNQLVAGEMLRHAGLDVVTAADGEQALDQARATPPDLILMDVHMPVMDGLAATRAWRAHEAALQLARTPVLALSATAFADERAACLAAGMDDHIAKPIDAPAFYATLLRWLEAAPRRNGRATASSASGASSGM